MYNDVDMIWFFLEDFFLKLLNIIRKKDIFVMFGIVSI